MSDLTFWERMGMDPPPADQTDWHFWYCLQLCERINVYARRELKESGHE